MDAKDRITVVRNSLGDIRSLLNSAQVMIAGYSTTKNPSMEIDVEDMINQYFSTATLEEALAIINRA